MKTLNEENIKEIIDKQFEIAGSQDKSGNPVKYEDVAGEKGKDVDGSGEEWHQYYTATKEEGDEFREWLVKYIQKTCKVNKKIAEKEASWIYLDWGLKIKN